MRRRAISTHTHTHTQEVQSHMQSYLCGGFEAFSVIHLGALLLQLGNLLLHEDVVCRGGAGKLEGRVGVSE